MVYYANIKDSALIERNIYNCNRLIKTRIYNIYWHNDFFRQSHTDAYKGQNIFISSISINHINKDLIDKLVNKRKIMK